LPRSSLSTEFVLRVPTRARFPGRVSRSTGHASSIWTSIAWARDKANGASGTAVSSGHHGSAATSLADHEVPSCSGSVVHISRRTKNDDPQTRISDQSLPGSPRSSAMRNSCPRGPPSCIRMLVPQSSDDGNEFGSLCAGFSRPGSGPPTLRSRDVRTPLPLSAARTRPGGTTTMGRERAPGRGRGDRP